MIIRSHAKLNLSLSITGKDEKDGYHFIDSVFDEVELHDVIEMRKAARGVRVNDRFEKLGIPQSKNVIYKAAAALMKECRIKKGVVIDLYKNIPDGAGMGGGSSNAAAVLKGMKRLFGLKISPARMKAIAFSIGADVPFFLKGGKARVTGKGEGVKPLKSKKKIWYVIVCPDVKVPTKYAYKLYDTRNALTIAKSGNILITRWLSGKIGLRKGVLNNDFEYVIDGRYPKIRAARKLLYSAGARHVSLSGSGSAVFAVFESREQAAEVFGKARKKAGRFFTGITCSA